MTILAVLSTKGGVGKSTIVTNLAVWLSYEGKSVVLLDSDEQGSSKKWSARRQEAVSEMFHIRCVQACDVSKTAIELSTQFENVVIDVSGRDSTQLREAMLVASVLIVPTRASTLDLETIERVDHLVATAKHSNPGLRAYSLISMASTNPHVSEVEDAKLFLVDFEHIALLPSVIHDRKVYRDAIFEGASVVELDNMSARAEIQLLGQSVFNLA